MYFSISVLLWLFHVVLHQLLWQACDTYEPAIASAKNPINFSVEVNLPWIFFCTLLFCWYWTWIHICFRSWVETDLEFVEDHHSSSVKFDVLVVGWKGSETPFHQMWPPLLYVTMISKEINFLQDPPQIEFCLFSIIHCRFCYLPGN